MKIPSSALVNTGDQSPVYKTIDDFFGQIINELEPKPLKRPTEFKIRCDALQKIADSSVQSDEFCHMLLYKQKVIAVVLETRNDMNYIQFDFFYKP